MTFVMTRTPYRISFFGGGSDYPEWYLENGGAVLSTTINKYVYISARHMPKFMGTVHRVVWRHVETVDSIQDILHPAIRHGLKHLGFDDTIGLEIHYQGDLPARAGMGSSSTFAVGLLNALHCLRGNHPTPAELTTEAIHLERDLLKDNVGSQDQTAAAYGGLNYIEFETSGEIKVTPLKLSLDQVNAFGNHLVLFFAGRQRTASAIAQSVIGSLHEKSAQISELQEMAHEAIGLLKKSDFERFGHLLNEAWTLKRGLHHTVSTEFIDRMYAVARDSGAWGGKLLGAGQAGFMCFVVPPDAKDSLIEKLNDYGTTIPIALDSQGSELIYSQEANGSPPNG